MLDKLQYVRAFFFLIYSVVSSVFTNAKLLNEEGMTQRKYYAILLSLTIFIFIFISSVNLKQFKFPVSVIIFLRYFH